MGAFSSSGGSYTVWETTSLEDELHRSRAKCIIIIIINFNYQIVKQFVWITLPVGSTIQGILSKPITRTMSSLKSSQTRENFNHHLLPWNYYYLRGRNHLNPYKKSRTSIKRNDRLTFADIGTTKAKFLDFLWLK